MKIGNKIKKIGVLLAAAVIVSGAVLYLMSMVPDNVPINIEGTAKAEAILTKWVYEHSKQISAATCKTIVQESLKTNKPLLIIALIEVESNFTPTAISSKGAIGLTQVMPGVWEKELISKGIIKERRDLFNVVPSVSAGDMILSFFLKQSKGDVTKALESYLGGQDVSYVKRILSHLANLYVLVESQ